MSPEEALAAVRRVAVSENARLAPVPPDWPLRVALAIDALATRLEATTSTIRTVDLTPPTKEPS